MKHLIMGLIYLICSAAIASEDKRVVDFQRICSEKAASAEAKGTMTVMGREGWMFLDKELRHISVGPFHGESAQKVSRATKPKWRDPLPAILDFKKGLDKVGIELVMVPVPPKAMVYPDMLDSTLKASMGESMTRLDPVHQQFYKLLQDKGITVLDLVPAFTAARFDGKGDPYCKQDSHWSGRGCEIAARHIIKTLKGQTWLEAVTKQPWDTQAGELQLRGDLWKAVNGEKPKQETLALRFVGKKDSGPLQPVQPDKNSPVILMGDSHTLVFQAGEDMHARGAGLADQLARELGFAVDLIGVRGSGATPTRITLFRRARSDANYLKNKKLLIWCFSAREFTEAVTGWRKVPVVK